MSNVFERNGNIAQVEYFSDPLGQNIIKALDSIGASLNSISYTVDKHDQEMNETNSPLGKIDVDEIIMNSLSDQVAQVQGEVDNEPPPPHLNDCLDEPAVANLDGLVDKYNKLLRDLDGQDPSLLPTISSLQTFTNNQNKTDENSLGNSDDDIITTVPSTAAATVATSVDGEEDDDDVDDDDSIQHKSSFTSDLASGHKSFTHNIQNDEEEVRRGPHTGTKPSNSAANHQRSTEVDVGDEDEDDHWIDEVEAELEDELEAELQLEAELDDSREEEKDVRIGRGLTTDYRHTLNIFGGIGGGGGGGGIGVDEDGEVVDEWEDDNDPGYVTVTISEREFFEMEEDCARRLALSEQLQAAVNTRVVSGGQRASSAPVSSRSSLAPSNDAAGAASSAASSAVLARDFLKSASLPSGEGGSTYDGEDADLAEAQELLRQLEDDADAAIDGDGDDLEADALGGADEEGVNSGRSWKGGKKINIGSSTEDIDDSVAAGGVVGVGGKGSKEGSRSDVDDEKKLSDGGSDVEAEEDEAKGEGRGPVGRNTSSQRYMDEKRRAIELLREARTRDIKGQQKFYGVDGIHAVYNLKIIFEPYKTGFEETKHFKPSKGTIIAGRFRVSEILGQAAFSMALQCEDLEPLENGPRWVCLKVIKNNKDFFDQSLDEIKLLQYINSMGDPDKHNVLKLMDFFYCKEHLFIVCELLRENLYDFGKYIRDNDEMPYFTFPRLKSITRQVLEALEFIHSLGLIHCDIKPENIVIKSYSRVEFLSVRRLNYHNRQFSALLARRFTPRPEVKLIDFGSSCFVTDHLTSYIQSRSYRAPEVILGLPYDFKIDIWSVGAVLAEMHTGYVLFQNDSVATMLARIAGILGGMPSNMIKKGREANKFYTVAGIPYDRSEAGDFSLIYPKHTTLQTRLHLPPPGIPLTSDEENFLDFTKWMLEVQPENRPYAVDALSHPWLKDSYGPYE